uniref:HNH endonuclease n=1 Tax=Pithovirus LCPAC401 TaxID=2506595 RepID=A0A481Z9M2_9VIRU|nr:MAG: uncharacterized protein LCPAC401_02260 [Pithovirus LCPAC401]
MTEGERCHIHKDGTIYCGSTDTLTNKPCMQRVVMLGDRCGPHNKENDDTFKRCFGCENIKPLEEFNIKRDGRGSKCKECINGRNYPRRTTGNKVCSTCETSKHVVYFTSYKSSKDGLYNVCSVCTNNMRYELKSTLDGFIKFIMNDSKFGAKKKGFKHEIDEQYVLDLYKSQNEICLKTGLTMEHLKSYDSNQLERLSEQSYYNMSLDRIDSKIGYIDGNVQVTTWGYNMIKGDLDEKEIYERCKDIVDHQKKTDKSKKKITIDSITEIFIRTLCSQTQHSLNKRFKRIDAKFKQFSERCTDREDLREAEYKRLYRRSKIFDITLEQLYEMFELQGGRCNLCDKSLTTHTETKLRPRVGRTHMREENHNNISIDRIDSLGDYSNDNVQIVCARCNLMKGCMKQPIFIEFCNLIVKVHIV